jgi:hypothetical protein
MLARMTLKEFGRWLAEREGIQPLRRGELRPDGYYMGNIATGKSRFPRGAVVNVQPVANETVAAVRRDEK